ncbi:hypothetical protein O5405_02315 [Borrelia miyamotoi]|nr:hypothetical protein [Borrelia miyamotoi]WAZ85177.1 hypothetical protein O5400_02315 [Borrelia miyamotoi]WAZ96113.1 hypothetical protein O5405_02315 [Borrelia miyamotoi]
MGGAIWIRLFGNGIRLFGNGIRLFGNGIRLFGNGIRLFGSEIIICGAGCAIIFLLAFNRISIIGFRERKMV